MTQVIELALPGEFGLEHDTWRPHQKETIDWALEKVDTKIIESPTGSGKTALAKAMSTQRGRTVALTRTKNLQQTNYAEGYGFTPLYGRANYQCALGRENAADCKYPGEMQKCEKYSSCIYAEKRSLARGASATTLNYAYWFTSHNQWPQPDLIVCDEAHQLPDLVLDWAGCAITKAQIDKFFLPMYPMIAGGQRGSSAFFQQSTSNEDKALDWLAKCIPVITRSHEVLKREAEVNPEKKSDARLAELLARKIQATYEAIKFAPDDWYIKSGPGALDGNTGFVAKPLTARHHFPHYFVKGNDLVIMSATPGNIGTFAEELGIEEYRSLVVPTTYKPAEMPVYTLDCPRMGQKATPADHQKQALEIAKAIRSCPGNWSGIVHVNSIVQANNLAAAMIKADRTLADRVWVPARGTSTTYTVKQWQAIRDNSKRVGKIIVTWNLHEGYDGTEEKINIVAKIPYPNLGSDFEQQRQRFNGKFYLHRAASGAEQMMGRTRRGREEDYDTSDERRGFNAFCDGSWNWVKTYFSSHFQKCLTKL